MNVQPSFMGLHRDGSLPIPQQPLSMPNVPVQVAEQSPHIEPSSPLHEVPFAEEMHQTNLQELMARLEKGLGVGEVASFASALNEVIQAEPCLHMELYQMRLLHLRRMLDLATKLPFGRT